MKETLQNLRREMAQYGIDTYIVLSEDAHQSEYVAPYWRARAFVSGFTGSAGTLVVTRDKAALWTDGRYFLQGAAQLEGTGIDLMKSGEPGVPIWPDWVIGETPEKGVVGIDGRTLGAMEADALAKKFAPKNLTLKTDDLADAIWPDRPALPEEPIFDLPARYTGETRAERIARLRRHMETLGADWYLVCSLESSAWLLNYRGNDVAHTPVAYAYTLIGKEETVFFIEETKVPEDLRKAFAADGIRLVSYHKVAEELAAVKGALAYDPRLISVLLKRNIAPGVKQIEDREAPLLWRAVKTETERENIREAHRKDAAVMIRFTRWLKEEIQKRSFREDEAAAVLDEMRVNEPASLGPSFETIVGYEANGAIIHYAPEPGKGAPMYAKGFVLIDSGAQFLEGTTDITRTIALGELTDREKLVYTLVLKGHIALGKAVFREGLSGPKLDVLARTPLWEHGLDYKHGTGHGVGYVLSVHEGPHTINPSNNSVKLEAGMTVTDEPGYYEAGAFGVRTENMLLVKERSETEWGRFLEFETLTLVPYERGAIIRELLTADEIAWINAYYQRIREEIGPRLSGEDFAFLLRETEAL